MQSIKAVVIGLAIVLLLGTGALLGVMVERLAGPGRATAESDSPEPRAARPAAPLAGGFGQLLLDRPEGSRIRSVTAVGALLVLHLGASPDAGAEQLVVIDPARGAVVGTIRLKGGP